MLLDYTDALERFEYDHENGHWICKESGRKFLMLDKDINDNVKVVEVQDAD